ncbi:MAG: winged helix DNA-binding domain-containing protein [Candidatus Limnocylindrales bacterium]
MPTFTAQHRRLAALRLVAQGIGAEGPATPVQVVRRMLALQAQDLPGVKWSVGLRQPPLTETSVEAACDAGTIVRSWPMRGTLHLVAAEDLGWMLQLTTPGAIASLAARRAYLGIADLDAERAREIAVATLAGGRVMAREDLLAAIAAGGIGTGGQRGYHLLWYLAQTGTLVLGPTADRRQMFALFDEWVPHPRRLTGEEALGELTCRYFESHGPATVPDLARWSGLTMGAVRRGLASSGRRLAQLELAGQTYYLAPATAASERRASGVHLLPGFDEYVLGYQDRTAVLARESSQAVVPGGNGMFKSTIVADGQVVGTWRKAIRAGEVVIAPQPFERLASSVRDGLAEAALAYGAFLGRPARIAWTA